MSISRYAARCESIAEELRETLSGDEYEDVFDALRRYTVDDWFDWRLEHADEVARLASAAPAERKKLLARMQGEQRLLTVFAACQYCHEAAAFLHAVDRATLLPGLSYRKMAAEAHALRNEMLTSYPAFWPWGGDPSFAES